MPSIEHKLVAPITLGDCLMDPIKAHLQNGWLPNNGMEARRLFVRAMRYVLIEEIIYKKSFVVPYVKCLRS